MEKNGDNMSLENGDIIVVRWMVKTSKKKIWTSVFTDFDSYLDFIDSGNKIIVTQDRKNNVFGAWLKRLQSEEVKTTDDFELMDYLEEIEEIKTERMNERKSRKGVI